MKKIIWFAIACSYFSQPAWSAPTKSYQDVKVFMDQLTQKYPNTVSKVDVGPSDSGETIVGLKIGSGLIKNLVVATHHGNEYGSTEVAMAFASALAQRPIPNQTVYVIPVLNVTGYNKRSRYEDMSGGSQDPNRDYPGPCGTDGPFKLKSTYGLAQFIDKEGIVASATLHTYYPAVVYPWGNSTKDLMTPYQGIFEQLVKYATVESKYQIGNSTQVIYPADGTFEDYAFWKHGIWSILFELGFSHSPGDSDVKTMIDVNIPGMRRMLENAPTARASDHEFHGRCDNLLQALDRRDE